MKMAIPLCTALIRNAKQETEDLPVLQIDVTEVGTQLVCPKLLPILFNNISIQLVTAA
jgi:hypothetical protein